MRFSDLRTAYDIAMRMGQASIEGEYRATMRALTRGETPPEPSCKALLALLRDGAAVDLDARRGLPGDSLEPPRGAT